jgi:translation initiation factor eIF-2B subunit delta
MLPRPIRSLVKEIASDTRSGALPLALKALDAYAMLQRVPDPVEASDELHRLLNNAQPWMASVQNASCLGRETARSSRWEGLPRLKEQLTAARGRVSMEAAGLLRGCRTLVTVSYSSDVLSALVAARREAPGLRVFVCESRPLHEGVDLARALRKEDIGATVVVDAAGPSLVGEADAVILGADALLRDGHIVNKVGSLPLALASEHHGVPLYCLMEVIKVELEDHRLQLTPETRDPAEVCEDVDALNFYFERVPAGLTTYMATDAGVRHWPALLETFRSVDDLMGYYLLNDGTRER